MADNQRSSQQGPDFVMVQKHLEGIDYPCGRDDLVNHAEQHGATGELPDVPKGLPDQQVNSPVEVSTAVTKGWLALAALAQPLLRLGVKQFVGFAEHLR